MNIFSWTEWGPAHLNSKTDVEVIHQAENDVPVTLTPAFTEFNPQLITPLS